MLSTNLKIHALVFGLGILIPFSTFAQDKKEKEIPAPERLELKTTDNVNLICTYFGGTNEKETVPIILLHDIGGSRNELIPFAEVLQKSFGYAVIVPDLRGHGESKTTVTNQPIDVSKFRKEEYATFNEDISCCFRYLRDEANNKGKANIDSLVIVSAGSICINAVAWTLQDYSYPPIRGKKQGQFVKGLVMLSPRKSIKGFSIVSLLKLPLFSGKGAVPIPLIVAMGGSDRKIIADGKSIHKSLSRTRPKVDDIADQAERLKKQTLFFMEFSNFSGTEIVRSINKTNFHNILADFVRLKVEANSDDHPWVDYTKKE
ncbi:alpha/beta hydrolase [Pirellulaceae bacterium]|nr:alpha/beta hydrolase [Pirellulaceae bacterium]